MQCNKKKKKKENTRAEKILLIAFFLINSVFESELSLRERPSGRSGLERSGPWRLINVEKVKETQRSPHRFNFFLLVALNTKVSGRERGKGCKSLKRKKKEKHLHAPNETKRLLNWNVRVRNLTRMEVEGRIGSMLEKKWVRRNKKEKRGVIRGNLFSLIFWLILFSFMSWLLRCSLFIRIVKELFVLFEV